MTKKLFDLDNAITPFKVKNDTDDTLVQLNNKELFSDINDIFSKTKVSGNNAPANVRYFRVSSGKYVIDLDSNSFCPKVSTLLNPKNFDALYLKQLENMIFSESENIDQNSLLNLVYIYSLINTKKYPIKITSNKCNRYLPKITNILNTFFNDNIQIIKSIYTMFNSEIDTKKEAVENKV
ncbi:MAG: hypothetical protein ACD_33C00036G0001 [uncultured bacterium]|nr:MAG: hypothetical protein ACD_33C00036G0001 [uncultured bacterium]